MKYYIQKIKTKNKSGQPHPPCLSFATISGTLMLLEIVTQSNSNQIAPLTIINDIL